MYSRRACTAEGRAAALLITKSAQGGVEPSLRGTCGRLGGLACRSFHRHALRRRRKGRFMACGGVAKGQKSSLTTPERLELSVDSDSWTGASYLTRCPRRRPPTGWVVWAAWARGGGR
jgi:hypothetical protein